MKTIKSITLGIVIGAVATLSITALAEYLVAPNAYPVYVDGQTAEIEGYNINDSTYFKLRDIGDKVGFRVDFANNLILVNTAPLPTATPVPTVAPLSVPLPDVEVEIVDGVEYVAISDIEKMLDNIGLGEYKFFGYSFVNITDVFTDIISNIPIKNGTFIPKEFYLNTIIPIINSLR